MRVEATRAGRARRRGATWSVGLVTGIAVVLAVTLVASVAFVLVSVGGSTTVAATYLKRQPNALPWNGRDRITALLIGSSTRGSTPQAMMVVSFDPHARSLAMLSIPTNLWVTIPGFGPSRLADAYTNGGPSLTLLTLQSVLHLPIPYYLAADAGALMKWVDGFGGVTMRVTAPVGGLGQSVQVPAGLHHLDGSHAIAYAGTRQSNEVDDADRIGREQGLLASLVKRDFSAAAIFHLPEVLNSLCASIATNIPYDQAPGLAKALGSVPRSHMSGAAIGLSNLTASSYSQAGTPVLLPDRQRLPAMVRILLGVRLKTRSSVTVLNGSGVQGQASTAAVLLRQAGVPVGNVASARSFDVQRSRVWLAPAATPAVTRLARATSALFQVPLQSGTVKGSHSPVTLVLGQDFQDPTQP